MLMSPNMGRITTLADNPSLGPLSTIGIELLATVCLVIIFALAAFEAGIGLSSYADSLAGFDECDFRADAEGPSYDFWGFLSFYSSIFMEDK